MFRELLQQRMPGLSDDQLDRLQSHYELLMRWNRVMNLTRITRLVDVVEHHYCESLFLGQALPPDARNIVDVGSGAGFPGIPVAATRPGTVTLVESHQRKCAFLREATRDWGNVRVNCARFEQISATFDWALVRAVRWEDVEGAMRRVTANAAVLGGPEPPGGSVFQWETGVQIPWGEQRFLYLGTNVSRGTKRP